MISYASSPFCTVSYMNASCHTHALVFLSFFLSPGQTPRLSHLGPQELSRTLTSYPIRGMGHVTQWMRHITHTNESRPLSSSRKKSRHTYAWVMSHIQTSYTPYQVPGMSHVTRMNESCHTYKRVTPPIKFEEGVTTHIWTSRVINESRHTYKWVTSSIWRSHVTHANESRHTYERVTSRTWISHITHGYVTSHIWMSHGTHMNESRHAHECVTSLMSTSCQMSHDTHMNESRYTYECASCTHTNEPHHPCVCPVYPMRDSSICRGRDHSNSGPRSLKRVTWPMTHPYVQRDSFMCATWFIHM